MLPFANCPLVFIVPQTYQTMLAMTNFDLKYSMAVSKSYDNLCLDLKAELQLLRVGRGRGKRELRSQTLWECHCRLKVAKLGKDYNHSISCDRMESKTRQ